MQDGTKREAVCLETLCCIILVIHCSFERFCLQHAAKECLQKSLNICEKNWREWSKIDLKTFPKSILEGLWRPLGSHPWNKVLPRPHFKWFCFHFGTPFGTSLGSCRASFFCCFFEVAFWRPWPPFGLPKHLQNETQKGTPNQSWKWLFLILFITLEPQSGVLNVIFLMFFWNTVLGWLLEPILAVLAHFRGPFWTPFWSLFGYHVCIVA